MNCIDVVELTLVLADAEDGHDVGVMQLGRGARLAVEPLDRRSIEAWCASRTFSAARRPRASSIAS